MIKFSNQFLVARADHTHLVHWTATKWAWSARIKICNFKLLCIFFQSLMIDHSNFTHNLRGRSTNDDVSKFVILHPLIIFATVDGRVFRFFTELAREYYNNIYIQEPVDSRVVEFCIVLMSVTYSRDHFSLYSLTALCCIYEHVYLICCVTLCVTDMFL